MFKNKTLLTVIGFLLTGIGFLAIFLNFVGAHFTFLYWQKYFGPLAAFGMKIGMVLLGFILIYFGSVDLDKEEI